ncbi:MAG TPA: 4-hydroxy-tetrahydrodipicolinate reductase [Egibacteraceae bacterium]|nr:4-hydroxy-tetrahydrodipicolinate reductase [Egibacteraceae bacterium]
MIRVAVIGAAGRMGSAVCAAVGADPDCELVARVGSGDSLDTVLDAGADVAVEFTVPASVKRNVAWLLERGVHTVVGATGLSDADLADLERLTGPANLFFAPNFAVGAVLAMQLAAQAARHLPRVEIIELHHDRKVDAPSGTALRTARLVAEARREAGEVPGPPDHPARGLVVDGVPVHSVRLPGVVASQEIVFGGPGQTLTIRHDCLDRSSFMPGVLLAIRQVATRPGMTVGLESLL